MGYIEPVILFLIVNAGVVAISEKKFGECLPITVVGQLSAVYLSQLFFHSFEPAIGLIYILCFFSILLVIIKWKKRVICSTFFSAGFYIFISVVLWYFVTDFHRCFSVHDEMSHWGPMVREMIRLDRFYSVPESMLLYHKEYPPFFSLLEFLWCRIAGDFREDYCSMAIHIFSLSMLLVPLEPKWKKKSAFKFLTGLLMTAFIVLLTFSLDGDGIFQTIYVDYSVAFIAASAFLHLLHNQGLRNTWDMATYSCFLTFLLMGKQIGLFYFGFLTLLSFLILLINGIRKQKNQVWLYLVGTLIPCLFYGSWNWYVRGLQHAGQFDLSKLDMTSFVSKLSSVGKIRDFSNQYIVALFTQNLCKGGVLITFVSAAFVLCIGWMFLCWRYSVRIGCFGFYGISAFMMVGEVLYASLMLVLYVFFFSDIEFEHLMSFPRYMGSYVLFELIVLTCTFWKLQDEKGGISVQGLMVIFCALAVVSPLSIIHLEPQVICGDPYSYFREVGNKIDQQTEQNTKVFIVRAEQTPGTMMSYFVHDGRIIDPQSGTSGDEQIETVEGKKVFIAALSEAMNTDDYVYIDEIHDSQRQILSEYLDSNMIKEHTLIKIKK